MEPKDVMERKHKIIELPKKLIIESTKRKLNAIEKGKIVKINELEEDLRIETVKRRIKEKSVSFKMKKKKKKNDKIGDRDKSRNNK